MLLFVRGEESSAFFADYLSTAKLFRRIFASTIDGVYMKAGNHESFSGNEDKNVKQ